MTGPNDGAARFVFWWLKSEAYSERLGTLSFLVEERKRRVERATIRPGCLGELHRQFKLPARERLPRTVIGRQVPVRLHLWMVQQSR